MEHQTIARLESTCEKKTHLIALRTKKIFAENAHFLLEL
jgi:hypothetical protein